MYNNARFNSKVQNIKNMNKEQYLDFLMDYPEMLEYFSIDRLEKILGYLQNGNKKM